jgi:putative acetyltransferase
MDLTIRNEEAKDIEQVRQIVRAAFPSDAESKLVDLLRENGNGILSLVALNGDEIVGHILFSPVTITPPAPPDSVKGIGLAPVAVRPDVQSQGIGSQLIREGLLRCKVAGFDYCVVLGNPKYYHRFGFERASKYNVQNEYGLDHEFMLIRFTDCHLSGLAQYASEFAELAL